MIEKPSNATCVASSSFCENAILTYGDKILTVQAHPEFTSEYELALLNMHKGKEIALDPSENALERMRNSPQIMDDLAVARWMARVLQGVS